MWSGRSTVWRGKPQDYVGTLLGQIRRTFPQLENLKAEYAWTGLLGNTVHRMPQIGEITPGLWLLSGFGNRGLNTTAIGGEVVARGIVEADRTWQLFSPFALVWSGGSLWPGGAAGSLLVLAHARAVPRPDGAAPRGAAPARSLRTEQWSAGRSGRAAVPMPEPEPAPAPAASPDAAAVAPVKDRPPLVAAEEAKMAPAEPVEAADEQPKPKRARRKKKNEADSAGEGTPPGGA